MKVLFISSGNRNKDISPLIYSQGESLKKNGIEIDYFLIFGKGLLGYLKNISLLRKYLRKNSFDLIHAHYSFSGFLGSLSGAKPLVVSLMGSDIIERVYHKYLIYLFYRFLWNVTIVKSFKMKENLGFSNIHVIPNGVDLNLFKPANKDKSMKILKWDKNKKHILFGGDSSRPEKNFPLIIDSINYLRNNNNIKIHPLVNIEHNKLPVYMNAADVLVLSSYWEGSPNVIKEAMACNCPIVATDVGDIKWVIGNTQGCYLTSFDKKDVAKKIKLALKFGKHTNGRERIIKLGLDSDSVATKIINVYKTVQKQIY